MHRLPFAKRRASIVYDPDVEPAYVHKLEDAVGDINLDYYSVTIREFPFKPGSTVRYTAPEYLEYLRLNINEFAKDDKGNAASVFTPYSRSHPVDAPINDEAWVTNNPLGTLVSIWVNPPAPAWRSEYGTVFTAQHSLDTNNPNWIFSTAYTFGDGNHPVSGNRQFGIQYEGNHVWTFFTRGADRTTNSAYNLLKGSIFSGAENLWIQLQARVVEDITKNGRGGVAQSVPKDSARYMWFAVCQTYWNPRTAWNDCHPNLDKCLP